jgi:hypothetical protein
MAKFRKKPVVIEAVQYLDKPAGMGFFELRQFVGSALIPYMLDSTGALGIETLEGVMRVSVGDWVIKGVNGEFYPCKPDIFDKTYEQVDEAGSDQPPGACF